MLPRGIDKAPSLIDLGYMINHAMFQRNGRAGYVLKPEVLRKTEDAHKSDKEHLHQHKQYYLKVTVSPGFQLGF